LGVAARGLEGVICEAFEKVLASICCEALAVGFALLPVRVRCKAFEGLLARVFWEVLILRVSMLPVGVFEADEVPRDCF